jgi:nucleotide-binding universal stress UspA family protein
MFHRIVVAVDGSAHAAAALKQAVDIGRTQQASLTLITAWQRFNDAYEGVGMGLAPAMPDGAALTDAIKADARSVLDAAKATVPTDLSVQASLIEGHPTRVILDAVQSDGYDLVAVGSRGRGGISALLLGSVSHSLIQHSPVPVLVVHLPAPDHSAPLEPNESRTQRGEPVIAHENRPR